MMSIQSDEFEEMLKSTCTSDEIHTRDNNNGCS